MVLLALLFVSLTLGAPMNAAHQSDSMNHSFNYIVTILMENHGLGDIIGSPSAPFMNKLASAWSLATNYTALDHPSLPNYLALVSGQEFATWSQSDCNPGASCNAGDAPNLVDRLESRDLTWKAYMEGYPTNCGTNCSPGNCFLGDNGTTQYAARHNPFVYFGDIVNSTERCSRIVPANSTNAAPDDQFLADLESPAGSSNFMWLTPNLCNDMHDCPISTGDSYLSQIVPKILDSKLFTDHKAALFIAFDEGNTAFPSDYVYAIWAGSVAKTGFSSSNQYSHYSFLRTVEANWHLRPLTSNDKGASTMKEFFIHPADHDHSVHEDEMKDHENSDGNHHIELSEDSHHEAQRD
ncbi:MAG: hypothetical protein AUI50_04765 [Crenarchaeota archaeon 13_1_40CM_2_52_14]|nr:MAG: hypothetical protein AUI97_08845 [Crenarchaeota archaeon 13_1_40CM_3_52_17]OLD34827.1 MAG: hypothetical protein AUI50_04765 [Crenarchaeota archaeon 13_1_40CM_2_52_14]OLE70063.1 MAG: hypothetical protein AUF78_08245 [archaeon 13_1_20CM_2_51_12]